MTDLSVTKTRIIEGVWEGVVQRNGGRNGETPAISVSHLGEPIEDVSLNDMEGGWQLRVPIPPHTISEGVQSYLIIDASTHEEIGAFNLIAGQALAMTSASKSICCAKNWICSSARSADTVSKRELTAGNVGGF